MTLRGGRHSEEQGGVEDAEGDARPAGGLVDPPFRGEGVDGGEEMAAGGFAAAVGVGAGRHVAAGAGRHVAAGAGRHVAAGPGRHVVDGPGRYVKSTLNVR